MDQSRSTNLKTRNMKKTELRSIIIKLLYPVTKRKILKAAKETHYIRETKVKMTADSASETMQYKTVY